MFTDASIGVLLIWFSVVAALLALGCLILEAFASRALAQRATGGCGLLLLASALGWWMVDGHSAEALGLASLGAVCLLAWSLRSAAAARILRPAASPPAVWGLVFVLGLTGAYRLPAKLAEGDFHPLDEVVQLQEQPHPHFEAQTDAGRRIPVFHYQSSDSLDTIEQATLADERFVHKLIRLAAPSGDCNCHGWTFTGGRFAIRGIDVPLILADNAYHKIADPQPGDLAVYTGPDGAVTHTGVVRSIDRHTGLVLTESKWGTLGVYLHAPEVQPFGSLYAFYRSPRAGHQIAVVPVGSESGPSDPGGGLMADVATLGAAPQEPAIDEQATPAAADEPVSLQ